MSYCLSAAASDLRLALYTYRHSITMHGTKACVISSTRVGGRTTQPVHQAARQDDRADAV